jgi:hypothetical protein
MNVLVIIDNIIQYDKVKHIVEKILPRINNSGLMQVKVL